MIERKLVSMVQFVLDTVQTANVNEAICLEQTQERLDRIYQYSLFLSQPLTLGMFVPCDEDGNLLSEPDSIGIGNEFYLLRALEQYDSAKESVLFEGFDLMKNSDHFFIVEDKLGNWMRVKKQATKSTIEDLSIHCIGILSKSAIKQLGL